MNNYYMIIVISKRNTILNEYNVKYLDILKDDMNLLYPDIDINSLIQNKEFISASGLKFLYHHFTW